ncbi:MAG TPA: chemotaxis protein CheW [Clostridia bacterium]|nr:chemotaxis protein CheW [Clostridia bacterium]
MALLMNSIGTELISVKKKSVESIESLVEELVTNKIRIENLKNSLTDMAQVKILEQELSIISEVQDAVKRLGLAELSIIEEAIKEYIHHRNQAKDLDVKFHVEAMNIEVEHHILKYIHILLLTLVENYFEDDAAVKASGSGNIKIEAHSDNKMLRVILETTNNSNSCNNACHALNKNQVDLIYLSVDETDKFLMMNKIKLNVDGLKFIKSTLASINGSVVFEPIVGDCQRVTLSIPLSTTVIKGMMVTVGSQTMVIPSDFVEAIIRPKNLVNFKKNRDQGYVIYMDKTLSVVDLGEIMNITEERKETTVLIATTKGFRMAIIVDSVIDQADFVVKPKHSILNKIPEIKGTTILGDGEVTLVVDIPAIIREKMG